jgi:bacteriocin biosynthesis cyclodehydratase domain-containing protein
LVDGDHIELSNITRQVLYTTADVGKSKVHIAQERLEAYNPALRCVAHDTVIESEADIATLLESMSPDLLIVSADHPEGITDWVDKVALSRNLPWSIAGYTDATGRCGPLFVPGKTGCRACHVTDPEPHDKFIAYPLVGDINRRYQVPSFGPLNGIIASLQAKEAICWLGGLEQQVASFGTLISLDVGTLELSKEAWDRNPHCTRCGHLFS